MRPTPPKDSRFDVLVVGSGIAGLRAAVDLAAEGARVAVVTKDDPTDSNTGFAQGGIAAALSDEDRIEFHFQDTLRAGDGLCDEEAVRILVEEGPRRILELVEWGTRFDREGSRLAFGQEGAHSRRRVLHAGGDSTGMEIVRALLERASRYSSLTFFSRTFSVDLILAGDRCAGLVVLDEGSGELRWVHAGATLLATGGAGRLFRETTNPPPATGDGVAIADRAGAVLSDLEFVQFHPTSLFVPGAPRFLLSEALRGEGAVLRNAAGERFMLRYHPDAELASRDAVSRGILQELERTGDRCVFLDLTGKEPAALRERFPRIYETCLRFGFDLASDRIPVCPSAHYFMGGVKTDLHGRTSLPGLYAAGEVACTGVHGANRLASNSLLEGLVFGARAASAIRVDSPSPGPARRKPPKLEILSVENGDEVIETLAELMWSRVGLRRNAAGLAATLAAIEDWSARMTPIAVRRRGIEARNLLALGERVAWAAREREESRGAHFRTDFPEKREIWRRRLEVRRESAAVDLPRIG